MAELGAVVGAVLAEFVRARVIADQLTANLVRDYETDPVLASMTVPRVTIGEATVTVRYVVQGIETPPPADPDLSALKAELGNRLKEKVAATLERRPGATDPAVAEAVATIAARASAPTVPQLRRALAGEAAPSVKSVSGRAVEAFGELPAAVRRKIGTKAAFTRLVERSVEEELETALATAKRRAQLNAILASKVEVAVAREELPDDPAKIQEVTVTVRPEDLDVITSEGS